MKGCILPFPNEGDLGITKTYRDITLTAIAAKVYNIQLLNSIWPEIKKILRKNLNTFQRKQFTTSQILTICQIIEGVWAKNLETTLLFIDFSKAFNSIHRRKMEQILLADVLPKETVTAMVCLPDGDINFFNMINGVLQEVSLVPYLFICCLDHVLQKSIDLIKENG